MLNTPVIARKFHELRKFITKTSLKILDNDLLLAIVITIVLLLIGVILGYENIQKIPITHATNELYRLEPNNKLSFMSNWDGPIYINIAKHGYSKVSLTNFFPLYPLLINLVNKVISSSLYSALFVAWVSLVGAIFFYLKVVKEFLKIKLNSEAVRAVLLFILFPSAVFMLASFTESLFAFLSLAAIYYAMKNRYLLAAIFGMFATATRPTGVFLILLVALILFENRTKLLKIYAGIIIGMLGILSYMLFLYIKYGNPMEFVVTQKGHGWLQHSLFAQSSHLSLMNLIFLIPIAISVFYWWKRKISFSIYSILFILIPVLGGQFGGFVRYSLMDFPVFIMFYDYLKDKKILYPSSVAILAIGWTFILIQYTAGYIGG